MLLVELLADEELPVLLPELLLLLLLVLPVLPVLLVDADALLAVLKVVSMANVACRSTAFIMSPIILHGR